MNLREAKIDLDKKKLIFTVIIACTLLFFISMCKVFLWRSPKFISQNYDYKLIVHETEITDIDNTKENTYWDEFYIYPKKVIADHTYEQYDNGPKRAHNIKRFKTLNTSDDLINFLDKYKTRNDVKIVKDNNIIEIYAPIRCSIVLDINNFINEHRR